MSKTHTEFRLAFREHPGDKPHLYKDIHTDIQELRRQIKEMGDNGKYYSIFMRETTDWCETIPDNN